MAKKAKKVTEEVCSNIAVTVSRFGHDPIPFCVEEGTTVEDVLEMADIVLTGRETVYIDGEEVASDDEVEDKDVLSIVTPKQAGVK